MTEQINSQDTSRCQEYGHIIDEQGNFLFRDIHFHRGNKIYAISVGTREYLEALRKKNERIADPAARADESILTFDDISDIHEICKKLTTLTPLEELSPFIEVVDDLGDSNTI